MAKHARKKDIESIKFMLKLSLAGYYEVYYSETEIDGKASYCLNLRAYSCKHFPATTLLSYFLSHIRETYKNIGYSLS